MIYWSAKDIMVIVVVSAVILISLAALLMEWRRRKHAEQKRYLKAAAKILQKELLTYSLLSNENQESVPEMEHQRIMVYLKTIKVKKPQEYVFTINKPIVFGRKKNAENSIFINEINVSQKHCQIICYDSKLWLQDLNSTNGTMVQQGKRCYKIECGNSIELKSNDKITVGSAIFKIHVFNFDLSWL